MNKRLIFALFLSLLNRKVYCQNEIEEATYENEESQVEIPEEGSAAQAATAHEILNLPMIDDSDTTTDSSNNNDIQCANNMCNCSQERKGDLLRITVDCSYKDLTELPTGIDRRVTRLLLQNNKLEEVPQEISEFKQLEELNINSNFITGFAFGSVSELPKLRILKASNNGLLDFPQELKNGLNLRNLEQLDLGKNNIREKPNADFFINMRSISSIILPETDKALVADLCQHLDATLEKVCTNDCGVNAEECDNKKKSHSIPTVSSGNNIDSEIGFSANLEVINETKIRERVKGHFMDHADGKNESVINTKTLETTFIQTKKEPFTNKAEIELSAEPNDISNFLSNDNENYTTVKYEETNEKNRPIFTNTSAEELFANAQNEFNDIFNSNNENISTTENEENSNINTETTTEVKDSLGELSNADETKIVDASLQKALNVALDANDKAAPEISGVSILKETGEKEVLIDIEPGHTKKIEDDVNGDVAGALSTKQGGGVSNSIVAMIVAGMVVVVAGVTIGKNWKTIKSLFSSRPTPATGANESNGGTPEEVPLQNKSIV